MLNADDEEHYPARLVSGIQAVQGEPILMPRPRATTREHSR